MDTGENRKGACILSIKKKGTPSRIKRSEADMKMDIYIKTKYDSNF